MRAMKDINDMNEYELEEEIEKLENLLEFLECLQKIYEDSEYVKANCSSLPKCMIIEIDEDAKIQRELYENMQKSISRENYEEAAIFRDMLRNHKHPLQCD